MVQIAYLLAALLPMVLGQCEIGWVHHKGQCYSFSDQGLTWFDSAASCLYYGARLVQIENADVQEWLTKEIIDRSNRGEECLEMRQSENYLWNDLDCVSVQNFICEKSPKTDYEKETF